MICAVNNAERAQRYHAALAGQDLPALQMAVHQRAFGELPGSGWQFYTGGAEDALFALAFSGTSAQCCGACDPEELSSFLRFLGTEQLTWRGPCPPGFHAEQPLCQMRMALKNAPEPGAIPQGFALMKEPPMFPVTELVAQDPEFAAQEQEFKDSFYARSCALRNRGLAEIWALSDSAGRLAATAGIYARDEKQAFLSGVHTHSALRNRGLGGWLVSALAAHMAQQNTETVLWCRPRREPFYRALGFETVNRVPQFWADDDA